eukprot:m.235660 g.235660  ORF g.235660 m.235660 type:complete len:64 (-) comp17407_c0_seq3:1390-1581(-)
MGLEMFYWARFGMTWPCEPTPQDVQATAQSDRQTIASLSATNHRIVEGTYLIKLIVAQLHHSS